MLIGLLKRKKKKLEHATEVSELKPIWGGAIYNIFFNCQVKSIVTNTGAIQCLFQGMGEKYTETVPRFHQPVHRLPEPVAELPE